MFCSTKQSDLPSNFNSLDQSIFGPQNVQTVLQYTSSVPLEGPMSMQPLFVNCPKKTDNKYYGLVQNGNSAVVYNTCATNADEALQNIRLIDPNQHKAVNAIRACSSNNTVDYMIYNYSAGTSYTFPTAINLIKNDG